MPMNVQTTTKLTLVLHANKVILKIFQAWLQHVNWEIQNVQAGFRKGRRTKDQIANISWIIEKAREFQKKRNPSVSLTTLNPWLYG